MQDVDSVECECQIGRLIWLSRCSMIWGRQLSPGVVNVDASPPVGQRITGSEICSVQSFLEEHCEFGIGLRTSSAELLSEYRDWSGSVASGKWFHARLRAIGLAG